MFKDYLIEVFNKEQIELSKEQADKFNVYSDFLVSYNEKVNLTAITDEKEIAVKHFLDSVMPLKLLEIKENTSLIDVGTGAGFPSVPMKIIREDLDICLLDSLNKRLVFLKELCEKLSIQPKLVHKRAEEAGNASELREKFDYATSRAVASLAALAEYCLPLVKVGGYMIALKGPDCDEEIKEAEKAVRVLGGGNLQKFCYQLPDGSGRTLVVIEKIFPTVKKFPRQRVKIHQNPIK